MTRADIAVIALLAAAIGWSAMAFWQGGGPASAVALYRGGERIALYPLNEPRQVAVEGRIGTSHIHIENGRARFHSSPCRNQVCVYAGWQTRSGAVAACVPNGLSLQLLGGEREYDGFAG